MAFSTAFQPNAFQNSAFQVSGVIPPVPPPLGDMHDGIDTTDRFAEKNRKFRKDAEKFHSAIERAKERAENPQKFALQPVVIEAAPIIPSPTLSPANVAALMAAYKLAQQQADDDCIVALLLAA